MLPPSQEHVSVSSSSFLLFVHSTNQGPCLWPETISALRLQTLLVCQSSSHAQILLQPFRCHFPSPAFQPCCATSRQLAPAVLLPFSSRSQHRARAASPGL